MSTEKASTQLPPAQPSYIFRGHAAQIHSVQIVHQNTRLVTGDAEGWVVCWKLESKRPVAVWRAHDAAILGTAAWGADKLITHGRDSTLRIWQLGPSNEANLSTVLPTEGESTHRAKPWLLHTLPVNTLNFCAFSMLYELSERLSKVSGGERHDAQSDTEMRKSILVAVPARDDRKAEVYRFPDEHLAHVVPRVQQVDTGMVMAVKLARSRSNISLILAGYEGGYTAVYTLITDNVPGPTQRGLQSAELVYLSRPHAQPILSLDILSTGETYYTSSADAVISAHRIGAIDVERNSGSRQRDGLRFKTETSFDHDERTTLSTSSADALREGDAASSSKGDTCAHSGLATSPSSEAMIEQSPLSFSKKKVEPVTQMEGPKESPSGISSLLSSASAQSKIVPERPKPSRIEISTPHKVVHTRHAGQQSLSVRSDDRVMATGGWDGRIRVYSTKTLKEVAVLKWHNEGVYCVDFGAIYDRPLGDSGTQGSTQSTHNSELARTQASNETGLTKLQRQREEQVQRQHWVVAGSKDGKVSLWNVF